MTGVDTRSGVDIPERSGCIIVKFLNLIKNALSYDL